MKNKNIIFATKIQLNKTKMDHNHIHFDKNDIVEISVSLFIFKDGDAFIAYCPSLDLSGYELTAEKALADFDFMLTDYLNWQLRHGTLRDDLIAHGWRFEKAEGLEPSFSEMLQENQQLRQLLTMPYLKTVIKRSCSVLS